MEEGEKKELEEKVTGLEVENSRLKEAEVLRGARDLVVDLVEKEELPDITKTRLIESLSKSPAVKDGMLDDAVYTQQIIEAIKAEKDYIATLNESGKIKGMGSGKPTGAEDRTKLEESFQRAYEKEGMSPEQAKTFAVRSAKGRS